MTSRDVVTDPLKRLEIDKKIRNKWKDNWLTDVITLTVKGKQLQQKVGECVAKLSEPGEATCLLCNTIIKYGSNGKKAIAQHLTSEKHKEKYLLKHSTTDIFRSMFLPEEPDTGTPVCSAQITTDTDKTSHSAVPAPQRRVCLEDRIANHEALVLAVAAEEGISFASVPAVIQLAKTLAMDPEALSGLNMFRTTASYKMKFGLARAFTERTVAVMQKQAFSLNIDEATSCNGSRVLAVLVNFVDPVKQQLVTEHLASISLERVDTDSVYNAMVNLFDEHHIPWTNLVSILMDSCAVMRGSKSGLEQRIRRNKAPHLLDVDGDVCHHLHNATKIFCQPFSNWVEGLFSDIHTEFHWSKVCQESLKEICLVLGQKFTVPQNFVPHRWLSVYDCAQSTMLQLNALTVYLYAFLSPEDKSIYQAVYSSICHDVSPQGKERLSQLAAESRKRSRTEVGKKRLERLKDIVFTHRKWTKMILGLYTGCLSPLKEYVCLFQSNDCLVHELNNQQLLLFKQFLAMFMDQEAFVGLTAAELKDPKKLDVSLPDNIMHPQEWFLGTTTSKQLKRANEQLAKRFRDKVQSAFISCAKYMQEKLPLDNSVLQAMAVLSPSVDHSSTETKMALKSLPNFLPSLFQRHDQTSGSGSDSADDQPDQDVVVNHYEKQVLRFVTANLRTADTSAAADRWWGSLSDDFCLLKKMVLALLTCFHGPKVESTFSNMSNIVDAHSARMAVSTLSAIQTVRYGLKAGGQPAVESFSRDDKLFSPVNRTLCRYMRTARQKYKEEQDQERERAEQQSIALSLRKQKMVSKQQAKTKLAEAEKAARIAHRKALRAANTARLEALSALRKKKQRAELISTSKSHSVCHRIMSSKRKLALRTPRVSRSSASTTNKMLSSKSAHIPQVKLKDDQNGQKGATGSGTPINVPTYSNTSYGSWKIPRKSSPAANPTEKSKTVGTDEDAPHAATTSPKLLKRRTVTDLRTYFPKKQRQ